MPAAIAAPPTICATALSTFRPPSRSPRARAVTAPDRPGLVLIAIESARLGDRLKWEKSRGGALFPHVYGPLDPAETASVRPLPLGPDGEHIFPPLEP